MGTTRVLRPENAGFQGPLNPAARRRLLVVDDDPTIRTILVKVLESQGYDVHSACNGAEAYDLCAQDPQPFDVLITDLMMPVMDGKELIRRVRTLQPSIRIISLSASYSDAWLELSVLFLPKPFSLRSIIALVKSSLEGPGYLSQAESA